MAYCVFRAGGRCQNWALKVVKRHARNAEPADASAEVQAERREREKVKLCGICLCLYLSTAVSPCLLTTLSIEE